MVMHPCSLVMETGFWHHFVAKVAWGDLFVRLYWWRCPPLRPFVSHLWPRPRRPSEMGRAPPSYTQRGSTADPSGSPWSWRDTRWACTAESGHRAQRWSYPWPTRLSAGPAGCPSAAPRGRSRPRSPCPSQSWDHVGRTWPGPGRWWQLCLCCAPPARQMLLSRIEILSYCLFHEGLTVTWRSTRRSFNFSDHDFHGASTAMPSSLA